LQLQTVVTADLRDGVCAVNDKRTSAAKVLSKINAFIDLQSNPALPTAFRPTRACDEQSPHRTGLPQPILRNPPVMMIYNRLQYNAPSKNRCIDLL